MNFFKRGFKAAKSALFGDTDGDADSDDDRGAGGGFAHKREVVVERPKIPVVQYAVSMYGGEPMGGIQGLWWYAKSLLCDDDGDVANQFLEVEPPSGAGSGGGGSGRSGGASRGGRRGASGDMGASGGASGEEREGCEEGEEEEEGVKISYSHALVEVKGVNKGEVLLAPRNLD